MPQLRVYNLFISHAWEYNYDYYRLEEMLDSAPGFDWRNYSVPEHDPKYARSKAKLTEALHHQIRPTHVVLILAGMYVPYREWIQREMDIALGYGKPIIGVMPWGSKKTPTAVWEAADDIVGWRTSSIVRAVRKRAL